MFWHEQNNGIIHWLGGLVTWRPICECYPSHLWCVAKGSQAKCFGRVSNLVFKGRVSNMSKGPPATLVADVSSIYTPPCSGGRRVYLEMFYKTCCICSVDERGSSTPGVGRCSRNTEIYKWWNEVIEILVLFIRVTQCHDTPGWGITCGICPN